MDGRKATGNLTTRERLIAAANELFALHGFNAVSTRALAAHAGCNLSMIHYYFGSKEGMLREIMRINVLTIRKRLESLLEGGGSSEDRFRQFVDFIMEFLEGHGDLMRLAFQEVLFGDEARAEEVAPILQTNLGLLAGILEGARVEGRLRDVDPPIVAVLTMGMLIFYFLGYPLTSRILGTRSPELIDELKRNATEILVRGVFKDMGTSTGGSSRRRKK
ncbi:MAG: TetR/AcrR family transcriptional regulator [Deltaproteobacteria bacterium]|nr:TetR/AcrR family transcriptional regulator [Deltaproteobacteria bacterium]